MTNKDKLVMHYLPILCNTVKAGDKYWQQVTCPDCIDKMPLDVKRTLFSDRAFSDAPEWWAEWVDDQEEAGYILQRLSHKDWADKDPDMPYSVRSRYRVTDSKREGRNPNGYRKDCPDCNGSGCVPQALYDPPEQCDCNEYDPPEPCPACTEKDAEIERLLIAIYGDEERGDIDCTIDLIIDAMAAYEHVGKLMAVADENETLKAKLSAASEADSHMQAHYNTEVETLKARVAELESFVKDIADNYDCDSDAHRYGTPCRACGASAILEQQKGD